MAGRTAVTTSFDLTDEVLEQIRAAAAGGEKVLHWCEDDVDDEQGALVARVRRQLDVRCRRRDRARLA